MYKKLLSFLMGVLMLSSCGDPSVQYDPATGIQEIVSTLFSDGTGVTMTNAAVAGTEITNYVSRAYIDLSSYTMVRAQFASSLTSALINCRIEYSLNNGSTWSTLIPNFAASTTANANNNSSWVAIPSDANSGILVRAMIVGNGSLDPIIRYVRMGYY